MSFKRSGQWTITVQTVYLYKRLPQSMQQLMELLCSTLINDKDEGK
jgi:hypothetical protein